MATDIGTMPKDYSVGGAGTYHRSDGGLCIVGTFLGGGAGLTEHNHLSFRDLQNHTLGLNFVVSDAGWKAETSVLTIEGHITWLGVVVPCTVTVKPLTGIRGEFSAVMGTATPITVSGLLPGGYCTLIVDA